MHPPLDRPHPDCQAEINALHTCHATTSKLKFWACNDVKFQLDKCLKEEKLRLLDQMNKDMEKRRQLEEEAYQKAMGKNVSFEEYLKGDKEYQRAVEGSRRAKNGGGA